MKEKKGSKNIYRKSGQVLQLLLGHHCDLLYILKEKEVLLSNNYPSVCPVLSMAGEKRSYIHWPSASQPFHSGFLLRVSTCIHFDLCFL